MAPLSTPIYVAAYYDLEDPKSKEMKIDATLDQFKDNLLIPTASLNSVWPGEEWKEPEADIASGQKMDSKDTDQLVESFKMASLRERAMETLLQRPVDPSEEDISLIPQLQPLSDFLPALKARLYAEAPNLRSSPQLLHILIQALQRDTDVDLAPFNTLSFQDLSVIISAFRHFENVLPWLVYIYPIDLISRKSSSIAYLVAARLVKPSIF